MKNMLTPFTLFAVSLISGCAAGARSESMIPEPHLPGACPAYVAAVEVAPTAGGQETNPWGTPKIANEDFTAALTTAVSAAGMTGHRYQLAATLTALDQPSFSHDSTITLTVRYLLTQRPNTTAVFDQSVTSTITVPYRAASKGAGSSALGQ